MIDLYLPPKPAIIRASPDELLLGNFLPGWFPGIVTQLPTRIYNGTTTDTNTAGDYTFTNHAIGPAHPSRLVVVGVHWANGLALSRDLASATIGGNAATIHRQDVSAVNLSIHSALISLAVPTGTTATIFIDIATGTALRCAVSVYSLYGLNSTTPVSTGGGNVQSGASASGTLNINAGGIAIAAATGSADEDHTLSGLTEDNDVSFGADRAVTGSNQRMGAATGTTITQSSATGTAARAITLGSWR